jgi:hypothetical protein
LERERAKRALQFLLWSEQEREERWLELEREQERKQDQDKQEREQDKDFYDKIMARSLVKRGAAYAWLS